MKKLLSLEEAALCAAALFFLSRHSLDLAGWTWFLLFFAPDISMLGYLAGPRTGAFCYNLAHHRGLALALAAAGGLAGTEVLLAAGILLFAHASFDRVFGYGLKKASGFADTHLGTIGRAATLR